MSVQSSDCTIVYMYIFSLNTQNAKIPPREDCFLTIQQPEKDRCFEDRSTMTADTWLRSTGVSLEHTVENISVGSGQLIRISELEQPLWI